MEEVTNDDQKAIERDIAAHPAFMANFYERKLAGSENLTMTDKLEQDRLQWKQNKEKAERILEQIQV